ncbi:PqqD family protein [Sphingomonas canadensis]|uniref:PqqD family protein n=1 Tax=Sphingomonas canadensis TaxID=1219257 RepID=A0ABW3H9X4_9SPHN|nr:PqqD family protein [Sphingomonas canadensis]MCW3837669.1 PqqD family peptide modification chaperone [Sphingomonas canadensis]
MNADTIVAQGKNQVEAAADGELVLMHVESGRFFTLTGPGIRVWQLMSQPLALGALADRLTGEFAVERDQCLADVAALCEQLSAAELIDVSP